MRSFARSIFLLLLLVTCAVAPAAGAPLVFGAYYIPDTPFPQFQHMFHEGWQWTDAAGEPMSYAGRGTPLGGYIFIYYQNMDAAPLTVADLTIAGVPLSEGLGKSKDAVQSLRGSSVKLSKLPKEQVDKLMDAGQPIWWKAEPPVIEPKATGQIVVRLKRDPKPETLAFGIVTSAGTIPASVECRKAQPRFRSITFSPELDRVHLYVEHPAGGRKPDKVFLNGKNITAQSIISADESTPVAPIVVKLEKPLDIMTYSCFRVGYPDGAAATAGIRAWGSEFAYGMWGGSGDPQEVLTDWSRHNINVMMGQWNGDGVHLTLKPGGLEFMQSIGMRQMVDWFGNARRPLFFFLQDEPDAQDYSIDDLQAVDRLGCLGQALVEKMHNLREKDSKVPILLNIDNTYKPENWYTYHQLCDIPCIDPYYQGELDSCYTKHPSRLAWHSKPTYVYAASAISQSSCAPRPLHVVLCATSYTDPKTGYAGRFPTAEEKSIEAFYALGAGAKGLSYWWFTPSGECNGTGADTPEARSLYRGIALLGAQLRTAGPVLTMSCPAALDVSASRFLWTRTLLCGADTAVLLVANDDILCDRVGTVYKSVPNAKAAVKMPSWLTPSDAFEVTSEGTRDAAWRMDAGKAELDLGTLELTRMVVLTSDSTLRGRLQKLYDEKFAANVAALK